MNTFEQLFFQHYCTGTFYEFILILKLEKVTNIRPTVRFPHPHGPEHLAFTSFFLHNASPSPSPPLPPSLPPPPRFNMYKLYQNPIHGRQALQGQQVLVRIFPRRLGRSPPGPFFLLKKNVFSRPFTSSLSRMQFLCKFSSFLYCFFHIICM